MWGDFDEAPAASKKDLAKSAESGWEAILETRKRIRGGKEASLDCGSLWGEVDEPSPKRTASGAGGRKEFVLFRLGVDASGIDQQDLEVRNAAQLRARLPMFPSEPTESGDVVDFRSAGVSRNALLAALEFALAGPGANERSEELWIPKQRRAISRASQSSSSTVESALHALEILRCAMCLGLPRLQEEAERRLLGSPEQKGRSSDSSALLCEASAIPLLASSFRREKVISQRCMQLLTASSGDFLHGKERQLGVVYATQPVVGCVLSGIFKAKRSSEARSCRDLSPVVEDLLLGPRHGTQPSDLPEPSRLIHSEERNDPPNCLNSKWMVKLSLENMTVAVVNSERP
eukprot:Skav216929  [mRNA]  locus=scaffold1838:422563:423603:+ [translate_table: standard]